MNEQCQGQGQQCEEWRDSYHPLFITPTGSKTVTYSKNVHSKKHKTHKISYKSENKSSKISVYTIQYKIFNSIAHFVLVLLAAHSRRSRDFLDRRIERQAYLRNEVIIDSKDFIIIHLLRIKAAHNTLQYIKRSSSNKREEIKTNTTMKETNVQN